MTALEERTTNSALSDMARDRLWMHFTRHSIFENGGEVPIITRGEGAYLYESTAKSTSTDLLDYSLCNWDMVAAN